MIDWTCGAPSASNGFEKSRMNRCRRLLSKSGGVASRNAAATLRCPAFTARRTRRRDASSASEVSVGLVCRPIRSLSPPIDARRIGSVQGELELVWILETANGAQVRAIQPDLELVLAIDCERMRRAHPTHRAERQPVEMHIL